LVLTHRDLFQIKGQTPNPYEKPFMKNPARFLCFSVAAQPLMAASGLCAAAVVVLVCTDRSPAGNVLKHAGAALPGIEKTAGGLPNNHSAATDPARALTLAFALEKEIDRQSRIRDLLATWAIRDAEAALDWVSSMEDPAARRSARSTVCFALAENDPRQAVTLALTHGADEEDDKGLLECLTMQWCEKECKTVVEWAQAQPPGEWRERLLSRASFVLSKSDPAVAAQIVSGLEPGTVQDEAAMAVLHQWALQDSAAALRWAGAFSEPILRERALAEIANLRNLATYLHEAK
jgi:hypothetical protein